MRVRTALLVALLLLLRGVSDGAASDAGVERLWKSQPGRCPQGVHHQPGGPFAALLFCEDALGDYLAVVYWEPLAAPAARPFADAWEMGNRVWQDSVWASDVTSFAWSPDGKRLYVTTSQVYGSGGLFELDLVSRKARQIAPTDDHPLSESDPGADYVITSIDEKAGILHYSPGDGRLNLGPR